jgi:hypothetical protein
MQSLKVVAGVVPAFLAAVLPVAAETNLAIAAFSGGYVTWSNVDPSLYYTVEWAPAMDGEPRWTNAFGELRNIRSTDAEVTVPVPVFLRVHGSAQPVHDTACTGMLSQEGRWCDRGDGTVRDTATGLVWLKQTDALGQHPWRNPSADFWESYMDAHLRAGTLASGTPGSGLTDGSAPGAWRLPTRDELRDLTQGTEAVSVAAPGFFTGLSSNLIWTSTSDINVFIAYAVHLGTGQESMVGKESVLGVWPVRGGR